MDTPLKAVSGGFAELDHEISVLDHVADVGHGGFYGKTGVVRLDSRAQICAKMLLSMLSIWESSMKRRSSSSFCSSSA